MDSLFDELLKFDYTHINTLKFRAHHGGPLATMMTPASVPFAIN